MSFSPFIDLASALGQKVGQFFTKQGVQTPNQRAVSTQGDSFDLFAGIKKLISPVTPQPTQKAGVQILDGATKIGDEIFNSLGRNVGSYIDNLFGNSNKIPSVSSREETNIVRSSDAFGSQYENLGEAFKLFSSITQGSPKVNNPSTLETPSNNNVLIIGGFIGLAAILLLTGRKA